MHATRPSIVAFTFEKQLTELGDQAPAELKSALEQKVKAVRDAISSNDVDKINESDILGKLVALIT